MNIVCCTCTDQRCFIVASCRANPWGLTSLLLLPFTPYFEGAKSLVWLVRFFASNTPHQLQHLQPSCVTQLRQKQKHRRVRIEMVVLWYFTDVRGQWSFSILLCLVNKVQIRRVPVQLHLSGSMAIVLRMSFGAGSIRSLKISKFWFEQALSRYIASSSRYKAPAPCLYKIFKFIKDILYWKLLVSSFRSVWRELPTVPSSLSA